MATPPAVLRGVDRASFAVALATRLRAAGVLVHLSSVESLLAAIGVCPPHGRTRLYWLCRVSLVRNPAELPVFDEVFDAVFGEAVLAMDPVARRNAVAPAAPGADDAMARLPTSAGADSDGAGLPWATAPAVVAVDDGADGDDDDVLVPELRPSALDAAAETPFDRLDPVTLSLLEGWLAAELRSWPTRQTRRMVVHPAGRRIALRATLARARRTGWETVELAHRRAVRRPRRVVLLCDVSESMRGHSVAYLHLMRAAARVTEAEAFAFSTGLTRLTAVLQHSSPEVAIDLAGQRCTDRFGGTRIATSVRSLLASHHGNAVRGAVVVIASDGWDSDDPVDLAAAMARLGRRAHRIVWLNPRAAAPGFEPRAAGMAAALPFCDDLLPAHTPSAMRDVLTTITRLS